jgi:creatinine amidohydrolase/Fe(II)-dependent formamide hydrolase-like protein
LAPDRVKLDKAVDERVKKGLEVLDRWKPTKSGVFGKPSLASRKKGKRIFQGFVDKLVEVVRGAEG